MSYSDPDRPAADGAHRDPRAAGRTDVPRAVLWAVLVLSAIGNVAASLAGAGTGAHLLTGAVCAASAITLGARFLRARR